ncbi:uncharacterized protein ACN427_012615 isoform 1-T1 [Glossina fuscipes fuscipes]
MKDKSIHFMFEINSCTYIKRYCFHCDNKLYIFLGTYVFTYVRSIESTDKHANRKTYINDSSAAETIHLIAYCHKRSPSFLVGY